MKASQAKLSKLIGHSEKQFIKEVINGQKGI